MQGLEQILLVSGAWPKTMSSLHGLFCSARLKVSCIWTMLRGERCAATNRRRKTCRLCCRLCWRS